jgi:hypothetical protein
MRQRIGSLTKNAEATMAKKQKRRRAWTASEIRELKSAAKKHPAAAKIAKKAVHRRSGDDVLASPAKSSTTASDWARAFAQE